MNSHQHSPLASSLFAAEIETATVSLLWHYPEWMAAFLRGNNPEYVFFQPHLRRIVEAINIAATELGYADWASVVQVVRELGCYIELGGCDGLNLVYSALECTKPDLDQPVFAHYCDMLKRYAIARTGSLPVYRFVRGDFTLEPNRLKTSGPGAPDFIGSGKFMGHLCRVMGYQSTYGIRLSILPQ